MKKKLCKCCFLFFFILGLYDQVSANTFIEKKIGTSTVRAIEFDIGSPLYDIKIVSSEEATTLTSLLLENNGISGVNGVFFCPSDYPSCGGKSYTINERYIEGKKIAGYDDTGARVVFGWDKDIVPFLFQTGKINPDMEEKIYEGFGNHPLLLQDGENKLEWYYDQGLIDKKMKAKSPRNFICSDKDKEHIYFGYVYTPTMDELVTILLEFGCYDALNLDAGKSASYVYNGRVIAKGDRDILDAVIIQRKDFEVEKAEKKVEKIFSKVIDIVQSKSQKKKTETMRKLSSLVDTARQKVYERYSTDIYHPDTGKKSGYTIQVDDVKVFEKIYVLNRLQYFLKEEMEKYAF